MWSGILENTPTPAKGRAYRTPSGGCAWVAEVAEFCPQLLVAVLVANSENLRAPENENLTLKPASDVCLRFSGVLSVGPVLLS